MVTNSGLATLDEEVCCYVMTYYYRAGSGIGGSIVCHQMCLITARRAPKFHFIFLL